MTGSADSGPTCRPEAAPGAPAADPGNLWALAKERALRLALLQLREHLGHAAFGISRRRCEHPGAVVLCKPDQPDVIAYLYTFGQTEGRFGLHLEYPQIPGHAPAAADIHEELTLARVAGLLRIHLDVA